MFSNSEILDFSKIRQKFHAYPELKYEEYKTSKFVENFLKKLSFDEVITEIGVTGVVGVLKGSPEKGFPSKSIGIRADMDALPIQEQNDLCYASKNPGVMHACGHDGHTTILLAAAKKLSEKRNFSGKVIFIFQPAEEGGAGGKAMIDDGLFERFPMKEIYALHNWPGMELGVFGFRYGPIMASSNQFEVSIKGKSGHAAMPNLCIDPVLVASHLIQSFQAISSRQLNPLEPSVIAVTKINAGSSANIISGDCELVGTVRSFSDESLNEIEKHMKEICSSVPKAFGAEASFKLIRQYPPTVNHRPQTDIAIKVAENLVEKQNVLKEIQPSMGAEDFAFMLKKCPGCYFFLGNGVFDKQDSSKKPQATSCSLHNSSYDFNDHLIKIGGEFWVNLVYERLGARIIDG